MLESSPSRLTLARRRARRLGWPTVAGHVAFMGAVMPVLRRQGRDRLDPDRRTEASTSGHRAGGLRRLGQRRPDTRAAAARRGPDLVVVHGTRIIAERAFREIRVPVVNMHAGITPRYRGVHGGYWAYADDRPELAGTTVHLVDAGIDTGGILGQATFARRPEDTIATYPYLHLACGLPVLVEVATSLLAGDETVSGRPWTAVRNPSSAGTRPPGAT